jgi:hypothetical protein
LYDLDVDTSRASAASCAEQIRAFMAQHQPTAFATLRERPVESIP